MSMKENNKLQFNIQGMSCAACVARVDKATRETEGVVDCSVNLLTNSMEVTIGDANLPDASQSGDVPTTLEDK